METLSNNKLKCWKQECIPVGCTLTAARPPLDVTIWGDLPTGWSASGGVCLQGSLATARSASSGVCPTLLLPKSAWLTDTSKNITFHEVGNDATLKFWNYTLNFSPSSYQNFGGFHLLVFSHKERNWTFKFLVTHVYTHEAFFGVKYQVRDESLVNCFTILFTKLIVFCNFLNFAT